MLKLFIFALPVILTIYGLIDCVLTPESDMRWLPKVAWVMAILLVPAVGAAIWLLWGREDSAGPRTGGLTRPGRSAGPQRTRRPSAPDDDPDFLRQLRNSDREHEQVLRQWERELRRREGGSSAAGGPADEQRPTAKPSKPEPPTSPPPSEPGAVTPGPNAANDPTSEGSGDSPDVPDTEKPADDGR